MTHPRRWKQMRLYERSPVTWRRSKIGRPGKDDRAMEGQPSNQKVNQDFSNNSTRENRRACGDSLWSERKTIKPRLGWRLLH
ncbi:MAG: hypothetical protein F6K26_07315 [Moorea sp. SIO2I5]|nr:hypothetical protein [Moorena sp. SIO2I5]